MERRTHFQLFYVIFDTLILFLIFDWGRDRFCYRSNGYSYLARTDTMAGLNHWLLGLIPHRTVVHGLLVLHVKLGVHGVCVGVEARVLIHVVTVHVARSEPNRRTEGVLGGRHHSDFLHFVVLRLLNLVFLRAGSKAHLGVRLAPGTQTHVAPSKIGHLIHRFSREIHGLAVVAERLR